MSVYKGDTPSYLKQSINSILNQTYSDLFILIGVDGTVTKELSLCLDDYEEFENIRIIYFQKNRGLAAVLNDLIRIGAENNIRFYARMDADDIAMPERIMKQVEFLRKHIDIDCLGTWAIEIDAIGNEYFRKQMPITNEECLKFFKKRDCMIHPSVMFRSSFFEKAGLYSEDTYFGEDTIMWAKGFLNGCKFANLPEYLMKFRLNECFFDRRRGWKHAKSIFNLRNKVNKMLGFGISANIYAYMYAIVKMMPKPILNFLYTNGRCYDKTSDNKRYA